ncbi:MAG: sulfotransferase family protein [Aeoliella sp.]
MARVVSQFSALSPLAKLTVWAAGVALVVGVVEMVAGWLKLSFSLLDKNMGGTLLIIGALVSLLAVLATERRPLAEYGLAIGPRWWKQGLWALAFGAGIYMTYCGVAIAVGVYDIRFDGISGSRIAKAILAGVSSIPIAAVQQIIFAGLLLGTLRSSTSRVTAILVPAVLFAAFAGMAKTGGLVGGEGQRLALGLAFFAILLGLLRLRTGSIVVPTGLLAGCILVRKIAAKLHLLAVNPSLDWTPWLAPNGDPRQAPAMWLLLAVGVVATCVVVWRYGEQQLADNAAVDASFKRIMPFSNLLAFTPLDRWIVLLTDARFRVGLAYVPRLLVTLIASTLNTLLALPERIIAPRLLKHTVPDPVFIVGMQRSGTTHLHNLLALDPQFRSPRNYEVFNPHGFLTGWLTTAVLTPLLMWRRPMDSVQMSAWSAQEEEFALAAMGSPSPYWSFCFPKRIDEHNRYWNPDDFTPGEQQKWRRHYVTFLRKITWRGRRRPLLKNPANTGRIEALKSLFPNAKFIYIVRHPHAVYRSNLHLANHGFVVFQLQDPDVENCYSSHILDHYRHVSAAVEHDVSKLPPTDFAQLRFEDLETNPEAEIERVYQELGLTLDKRFRARLKDYIAQIAGYRKNRFTQLPLEKLAEVDAAMGPYLKAWGYEVPKRLAA